MGGGGISEVGWEVVLVGQDEIVAVIVTIYHVNVEVLVRKIGCDIREREGDREIGYYNKEQVYVDVEISDLL